MADNKYNFDAFDNPDKYDFSSFDEAKSESPSLSPEISQVESAVRGAAQGATLGFSDEIQGAAKTLPAIPTILTEESPTSKYERLLEEYRKQRDLARAKEEQAKEANPMTYTGSEIAGGVATTLVPGLGAATVPKMLATGAALGAAQGVGSSEADLTERQLGNLAVDATMGGAFGLAGGAVGAGLGKGISKLRNIGQVADEAAARAAGVKASTQPDMTPEQIRSMGRVARQEDLIPWSGDPEEILKRSKALRKTSGEGIGQVTQSFDERGIKAYDPLAVASDVSQSTNIATEGRGKLNELLEMIKSNRVSPSKQVTQGVDQTVEPLSFKEAQAVKGKLGKEAFGKGGTKESKEVAKAVGAKVDKAYLDRIEQVAQETNDPGLLEQVKKLRKQYQTGSTFEDTSKKLARKEMGTSPKLSLREAVSANLLPGDAKIAKIAGSLEKGVDTTVGKALTSEPVEKVSQVIPPVLGRMLGTGGAKGERKLPTYEDITKVTDNDLDTAREVMDVKGLKTFSSKLDRALETEDPTEKQSILFDLQQQPAFRKALKGEE